MAREAFYATRPVLQWYVFVYKAKMIYGAVLIGGFVIVSLIALASPNISAINGSLPKDELAEKRAAQSWQQAQYLAMIEGDPRRVPMRTDLDFANGSGESAHG